jgi:hypothetical protein
MTPIVKMTMAAAMLAGMAVMASPAAAADNPMQVCGAKYRAAKTDGTLPAGQTWMQFLAQCRADLPKPAVVAASDPSGPAGPKAAPSAARAATAQRQHQCGAQWKADKAAGKIPAGQTWPQYWSACNKRLK